MIKYRILLKIHQTFLRKLIYDAWFCGIIIYLLYSIYSIKIQIEQNVQKRSYSKDYISNEETQSINFVSKYIDFEGFDNEIGVKEAIVPNIVHYLNLNNSDLSREQYWSILSVIRHQKPAFIYIHRSAQTTLKGHYWSELMQKHNKSFIINSINHHETIFETKPKYVFKHISDILRLEILIHYGGVFLGENIILAESLEKFFNFEMTVFSETNDSIDNNIIIANQNARFLKSIYDTYRYIKSNYDIL
jgi:hypothetical protein